MTINSVDDAVSAARSMLRFGPTAVIATLGARGAVVVTRSGLCVHISVPPVKAVDSTVCSRV